MAVVATHDGHQVLSPGGQRLVFGYPAGQAQVHRVENSGHLGSNCRIPVEGKVQESSGQPYQDGRTDEFVRHIFK
jgi:hypothetical protein